jgi:hypothetical protein
MHWNLQPFNTCTKFDPVLNTVYLQEPEPEQVLETWTRASLLMSYSEVVSLT